MAIPISVLVVCFICKIQFVQASYHQTPSSLKRDMYKKDTLLQQQPPSIYYSNDNPTRHMPSTLKRDRDSLQTESNEHRILHMVGLPHEHDDIATSTKNNNDAVPDLDQYSWQDYLHPDHELKTNTNNATTDTSLFDTDQLNNPLESNRDEILNSTNVINQDLSYSPSISPPPSPTIGTDNIAIHTGPHFQEESADDEFYTNTNDDPILPDNYNPQYGTYGNDYTRDDTDFREFVAFVGWYAFLIICCLLPTFCAYYRRRRSARALRDNLTNIQERLAEIESRRNEEDNTLIDLNGENRDRDWEYLESLFGGGERIGESEEASSRRRIMGDIMGSVGIRVLDIMERDLRRRKEKGRRMVAVLKETSLRVQECHLVTKDDIASTHGLSDNVDGDIEMGRLNMDTENHIDKPVEAEGKDSTNHTKSDFADSNEQPKPEPLKTDIQQLTADKENGDNVQDEPQSNPSPDDDNKDNTIASETTTLPPQDPPPILSSLYQVDDPYIDSDDEENKYSALCIPCTNSSDTSPTPRVVPNSCIICLNSYEPGCYVSWSSDKECCHAFHRDCILMWLLKKDEPLCPCCRREFIPEALLNGDNVDEEDESETDINRNDLENGNSSPTQTEQRAVTPRWDTLSVTAASLSSRGLPTARPF